MKSRKQLAVISAVVFMLLVAEWPALGQFDATAPPPVPYSGFPAREQVSKEAAEFISEDALANSIIKRLDRIYSEKSHFTTETPEEARKTQERIRAHLRLLSDLRKYYPEEPLDPGKYITGGGNHDLAKLVLEQIKDYQLLAIPALIENIDDDAFLYKRTGWNLAAGEYRTFTVGIETRLLIDRIIDPTGGGLRGYKAREGVDGKLHVCQCYPIGYRKEEIEKWWKEHSGKSLVEIHLIVIEWIIEQETEIGFPEESDREQHLQPYVKVRDYLRKVKEWMESGMDEDDEEEEDEDDENYW